MNSIRTLVASVIGTDSPLKQSTRPDVQAPSCETLEGRQLLNASGWAGALHWNAITAAGTTDAALVQPLNGVKDASGHHFPGPGFDLQLKSGPGHAMPALSTQAKADMQTLSADINKLQSEVPASLQAQIKADQATIENALSSLTPQQGHAAFPAPTTLPTTPADPSTILTTELKAANLPAATIDQITSDFQTYRSTLENIDPTLRPRSRPTRQRSRRTCRRPQSCLLVRPQAILARCRELLAFPWGKASDSDRPPFLLRQPRPGVRSHPGPGMTGSDAPLHCKGVPAEIVYPVTSHRITVYPRDEAGNRRDTLRANARQDHAAITIGPQHRTLWDGRELRTA